MSRALTNSLKSLSKICNKNFLSKSIITLKFYLKKLNKQIANAKVSGNSLKTRKPRTLLQ